ncbi:hypothetical protein ACFL3Q_11755 [Planctomycetota bacterium]
MHELGNVRYAAQSIGALTPPRNELPNPKRETVKTKIANDDAAAAVINPWAVFNPWDTQGTQPGSESSKFPVYSDAGKIVEWFREEIISINSFDGFMLGVHEKIEEFTDHTEFGLDQVLDVEQNIADLHETLEI